MKAKPRDVFLELGKGEKILIKGSIPNIPEVTAGLTVKIGLTVPNLVCEVDFVLGMIWLQLVNPVVDWGSGNFLVPTVPTALLVERSHAGKDSYYITFRGGSLKSEIK